MTCIPRLLRATAVFCLIALQGFAAGASDSLGNGSGRGRVDFYPLRSVNYLLPVPSTVKYDYRVYVPSRHSMSKDLPLFVMVHGCGTTADQQMHASQINELAEAEGFLVMHPDNGGGCWRAVLSALDSIHRGGGGEADLLAEMTRATMANYNVDPERVYMIGMSSGAFQTTHTAAAYPEIYAAVGVMAGGGFGMNVGCIALPDAAAPALAPLAIAEMGTRARVIPFISLGGTTDPLGETPTIGGCSRLAFIESMATNMLLAGNRYAPDLSSTVKGQVPNGYSWTKEVWRDRSGCQISERWIIDSMGHYWSGGSSDPQWAPWTDPKGPSANRAAWEFFSRYRKSDTINECAESRR